MATAQAQPAPFGQQPADPAGNAAPPPFLLAQAPMGQPMRPGQRQAGPVVVSVVPIDSIISAVQPAGLVVTSADNQPWLLRIGARTVLHVVGKAEADVLKPGVHVRFMATVDKRQSRVIGKVTALTIFTPGEDSTRMLGVFYPQPDGDNPPPGGIIAPGVAAPGGAAPGGPAPGGPAPGGVPPGRGAAPGAGAPGARTPGEEPARPNGPRHGPRKDDNAATNEEQFDIRGQVVAARGDSLTISAPNNYFRSPLRIELDEHASISLDVIDLSYVRVGDRVQGRGVPVAQQTLDAIDLTVTLAEAVTTHPGKKPPRTAKTPPHHGPQGESPAPFAAPQAENAKPPEPPPAAPNPQPGPPPVTPPVAAPAPAEALQRATQIVDFLKLPPQEAAFVQAWRAHFTDGSERIFVGAKGLDADELEKRFGKPVGQQDFNAKLPDQHGNPQPVAWRLWDYGPLQVLIDETSTIRYFAVRPEKQEHP